jgi:hypothetical protein
MKLAKDTQMKMDDYENIFQIGAVIEVSWCQDNIVETDLLHGKQTFLKYSSMNFQLSCKLLT